MGRCRFSARVAGRRAFAPAAQGREKRLRVGRGAVIPLNLEQALLNASGREKPASLRSRAEQLSRGGAHDRRGRGSALGETSRPRGLVARDRERMMNVDHDVANPLRADKRLRISQSGGLQIEAAVPERMFEPGERPRERVAIFPERVAHGGPVPGDFRERGNASVRVIGGSDSREMPRVARENPSLAARAKFPPRLPEFAQIPPHLAVGGGRLRSLEKARHAEEQGLARAAQADLLREQEKWRLVSLVAERRRERRETRLVPAVRARVAPDRGRLEFEPMPGGGLEQRANFRGFEPGERGRGQRTRGRLAGRRNPRLRDLAMVAGPREEPLGGLMQEDVEDRVAEGGIRRVAVALPIARVEVEFDGAAQLAVADSHARV
jgi:hypothetical protein